MPYAAAGIDEDTATHNQSRHGLSLDGRHARLTLFFCEQPFLYQRFRVDKIRISRKGGEGLIRGVPIAGRTQGAESASSVCPASFNMVYKCHMLPWKSSRFRMLTAGKKPASKYRFLSWFHPFSHTSPSVTPSRCPGCIPRWYGRRRNSLPWRCLQSSFPQRRVCPRSAL